MKFKSLKILILILISLLIITLVYVGVQKSIKVSQKPFVSYALASLEHPRKVAKIEIKVKNTLCIFEKLDAEWQITSPVEYPVDTLAFNQFLSALQELEIGQVISDRTEKYADFEVAENGIEIKVYTLQDSVVLILGKQAADHIHWYIRILPGSEVYLSRGLDKYVVDKSPDKWRDPSIISFDTNTLKEIVLGNKRIIKTDTLWVCDRGEVDKQKVEQVIKLLSNLKADGFSKEELEPEFTVKLGFITGEEKILHIGKKVNGNYLIKLEDKPVVFLISSSKVDRVKEIGVME